MTIKILGTGSQKHGFLREKEEANTIETVNQNFGSDIIKIISGSIKESGEYETTKYKKAINDELEQDFIELQNNTKLSTDNRGILGLYVHKDNKQTSLIDVIQNKINEKIDKYNSNIINPLTKQLLEEHRQNLIDDYSLKAITLQNKIKSEEKGNDMSNAIDNGILLMSNSIKEDYGKQFNRLLDKLENYDFGTDEYIAYKSKLDGLHMKVAMNDIETNPNYVLVNKEKLGWWKYLSEEEQGFIIQQAELNAKEKQEDSIIDIRENRIVKKLFDNRTKGIIDYNVESQLKYSLKDNPERLAIVNKELENGDIIYNTKKTMRYLPFERGDKIINNAEGKIKEHLYAWYQRGKQLYNTNGAEYIDYMFSEELQNLSFEDRIIKRIEFQNKIKMPINRQSILTLVEQDKFCGELNKLKTGVEFNTYIKELIDKNSNISIEMIKELKDNNHLSDLATVFLVDFSQSNGQFNRQIVAALDFYNTDDEKDKRKAEHNEKIKTGNTFKNFVDYDEKIRVALKKVGLESALLTSGRFNTEKSINVFVKTVELLSRHNKHLNPNKSDDAIINDIITKVGNKQFSYNYKSSYFGQDESILLNSTYKNTEGNYMSITRQDLDSLSIIQKFLPDVLANFISMGNSYKNFAPDTYDRESNIAKDTIENDKEGIKKFDNIRFVNVKDNKLVLNVNIAGKGMSLYNKENKPLIIDQAKLFSAGIQDKIKEIERLNKQQTNIMDPYIVEDNPETYITQRRIFVENQENIKKEIENKTRLLIKELLE